MRFFFFFYVQAADEPLSLLKDGAHLTFSGFIDWAIYVIPKYGF